MNPQDVSGDLHERARQLIDRERVEGLTAEEGRWLAEHLAACGDCAGRAAETDAALRALRTLPVTLPRGLAASTFLRTRAKAAELRHQRARNLALAAGCALSWMAGVASAPLVWRLCAWLGSALDLPRLVWQLGFWCWWLVPTAAAALVIFAARARRDSEFKISDSRWQ